MSACTDWVGRNPGPKRGRRNYLFQTHNSSVPFIWSPLFALGTIATVLAPETKKYRWITAASWDRILTRNSQPQWYGTQFKTDKSTGKQVQERIAEGAVTDAEREALGVPSLKESEEMLKEINGEQSP